MSSVKIRTMKFNLGVLFLLVLFTPLPLPFALATPVPGPPLPLDWMDQRPTYTHKPLPSPPFPTSLPPLRRSKEHPCKPLYCGSAIHKHGFAADCIGRKRDGYMAEGKRDGTAVRMPQGGIGRPMVCTCPLIYSWLLDPRLSFQCFISKIQKKCNV